jgi:iron complex outermembrane recepter protein
MRLDHVVGILGLFALGSAGQAQTGTISGQVLDAADGSPLTFANVVIVGTERGTATADDGSFRIESVPAGALILRASFVGFRSQEQALELDAHAELTVVFELLPESEAGELLVTADRLRSVGRTRALPHLIPQGVSVLSEAQLRAQGSEVVESALRNVSSVVMAGREQPFATFTLRGFPADGTGSFRRNGVEIPHLFDGLRPNVVGVELLKGPASVLYGRLEPGGVVNFVTRRPRCAAAERTLIVGGGSFGDLSAGGRYDPRCLGRVAAAFDARVGRSGSHRGDIQEESGFISGVAEAFTSRRSVRLTFDGEFEAAGAVLDPGVVLSAREPEAFDRRTFFGEPDGRYRWRNSFASVTAEHWPAARLLRSLTGRIAYGSYSHGRHQVRLDSLTTDGMVARSFRADDTDYRYLYSELSADGELSAGPVASEFIVGLEATRLGIDVAGVAPLRATEGGFRFAGIDPVALENPRPTGLPASGELVEYAWAEGSGLNLGLFGQNRMRFETRFGNLHAVISARLARVTAGAEWFALAATPDTPAGLNERHVSITALTPSAALLILPVEGMSVYGSYGTSFNPVFQQVDAEGQPFEPTRGEQFEAGVKYQARRLSATVAAFDIEKRGALSLGPDGFYVQTGAQRSRGFELDVAGSLLPRVTVLGAYTLLEASVTADEVVPIGNRLPAAPRHSGRLWGLYEVITGDTGLDLSLGVQYVGERFSTLGNEVRLPAHRLVDAALTFRRISGFEIQLLGENLLDERYLISGDRRAGGAGPFTVGWPGPPRSLRMRARIDL